MSKALKRIVKDIEELQKEPVAGISMCVPDTNNMFELHGNILITSGLYEGILLHTFIHIPPEYPEVGPAMHISPNIKFDHRFHEHVMGNEGGRGYTICNDMLTNYEWFFDKTGKSSVASGWTSGCTLKALLIQMTVFFADPDLPKHCLPSIEIIQGLKKDLESFKCECGHSTKVPYPPIVHEIVEKKADPLAESLYIAKNRLMCGASRLSVIDDGAIIGYPIDCFKNPKSGRFTFTAYIEPLSYESYLAEHKKHGPNMVSSYGHKFNQWLPMYINKEHFAKATKIFEDQIVLIKGVTQFKPADACEVLCLLMNQTMIAIFNGSSHDSQNLIEGYCHLLQLIDHLMRKYPIIKEQIKTDIVYFQKGKTNKTDVPDIGVFMMKTFLLQLCNSGHTDEISYDKIKQNLLREYFARQVFWMNKDFKLNHKESNKKVRLAETFKASAVSNRLYMFLYNLFTSLVNDSMIEYLNSHYGMPPQAIIDELKAKINTIKDKITNYYEFAKVTNLLDVLNSEETTFKLLNDAVHRSNEQGYTKLF